MSLRLYWGSIGKSRWGGRYCDDDEVDIDEDDERK